MKTPIEWMNIISVVSNPTSVYVDERRIAAIQADARQGMVPAITRHAGDCTWWSWEICDCGYLMRANSHDFGEPSSEIIEAFMEHQRRIQSWMNTGMVPVEKVKELFDLVDALWKTIRPEGSTIDGYIVRVDDLTRLRQQALQTSKELGLVT